jgi:N4-gp56 family major capsid protein
MAINSFATNDALTKKAWDEKLFRDVVKESYFSKFMSEKGDNLIHVKTQLERSQGDNVTFALRMRGEFEGVTGSTRLEGNENSLTFYSDSVSLELYRIGVRVDNKLDAKRVMFSIEDEAKEALKESGTNKIEKLAFDAILADATINCYQTSATNFLQTATPGTAKAALHATNSLITPAFLSALKTYAKTGGGRDFVPLRPIKIGGKDYYVLLVHPDVVYDLKQNAVLQGAWENARERSMDNPLFRDAEVVWDGVVVHSNERVTIGTDGGGASVAFCKGVLMGAQSLIWAWGQRPQTVTETFDYKREIGYGWDMMAGVSKPQFNSQDFGSIGVYCARTNVSGA